MPARLSRTRCLRHALLALALLAAPAAAGAQELPQVPYLTTPTGTVQRMLELVGVTATDTVYDLGSGDGRIPIIAAGRHGARGVGVELRRDLVEEARENAARAGVADRARFIHGDLFDVDLSPATVVTIYLLPSVNLHLRPKLLRELRPGARIVSNGFAMGEWEPDERVRDLEAHMILYAWTVPAWASGRWRVTLPSGRMVVLEVEQRFQELRARVVPGVDGGEAAPAETGRDERPVGAAAGTVRRATLRGRRIELELAGPGAEDDGRTTLLRGRVSGDVMRGSAEDGGTWSAERLDGGDASLERWRGG